MGTTVSTGYITVPLDNDNYNSVWDALIRCFREDVVAFSKGRVCNIHTKNFAHQPTNKRESGTHTFRQTNEQATKIVNKQIN